MEHAVWVDGSRGSIDGIAAGRVYFGHETCERLLPTPAEAVTFARRIEDAGASITYVTPFLSSAGLTAQIRTLDALVSAIPAYEVVSNDWGLVYWLLRNRAGTPVLGRLLAGQITDPRMSRIVSGPADHDPPRTALHRDGTECRVQYRAPCSGLAHHYRTSYLANPDLQTWFANRGLRRAEVSNVGQGLSLAAISGWSFSLHIDRVLVSVMRACRGESFDDAGVCSAGACNDAVEAWTCRGIADDVRRDRNAVYYRCDQLPPNLDSLPIDRLVRHAIRNSPRAVQSGET